MRHAPPLPPEVAIIRKEVDAVMADDEFLDRLADSLAGKRDTLVADLRRYLRIPADRELTTTELSAMVGVQLLAANAVMEALVEQAAAKAAAEDGAA